MTTATNQFCTLNARKFGFPINYNCNNCLDDTITSIKHESIMRRRMTKEGRRGGIPEFKCVNISDHEIINQKGKKLTECDDQGLNRSYGSLSQRKKDKIITSIQRVHQRSRSVGNDNHFSLCLSPSKQSLGNMSSTRCSNHSGGNIGSSNGTHRGYGTNGSSGGLLNPFKATKKFFRKIYDTATLPSRLHSKILASSVIEKNEIPTTSVSSQYSFLDASYSLEIPDDEPSYQYDNDITNQDATNCSTTVNHDSDLAPSALKPFIITDDTMNDSGLSRSISSNDSQKTSFGDFRSWNEVFNHLKREMAYMRQRDAQIFADLQFVEHQLRNVKNQAMAKSDYIMSNNNNNNSYSININNGNNDGYILNKRQIKLGDLVESMPL
ncbi:Uncharacterized protein BM_BM9744 [Brugia malayi]|nr:Uncharacterized protein BM_BM9744 [Brugia malayi]VIO93612.1 Uncharacterized protein BM_BM9744 [Brugia malayi]